MELDLTAENISLLTKVDNHELLITCDEYDITQVFYNLIKNAIEAMETGTITIRKEAGELIYIDVTDNGSGIPDGILDQIGEPFMTTKGNGTGLGLLISEKIIKEHNGDFFLKTKKGEGTTFTISLPKA